jgi:hypothetical protein
MTVLRTVGGHGFAGWFRSGGSSFMELLTV